MARGWRIDIASCSVTDQAWSIIVARNSMRHSPASTVWGRTDLISTGCGTRANGGGSMSTSRLPRRCESLKRMGCFILSNPEPDAPSRHFRPRYGHGGLNHERISILRVPGDRPPARRGGSPGPSGFVDAGADHRHELHQLVRMGLLQGRSGQTHGSLVRLASLHGELGVASSDDEISGAADRPQAPR